jgi:hypothetical protein
MPRKSTRRVSEFQQNQSSQAKPDSNFFKKLRQTRRRSSPQPSLIQARSNQARSIQARSIQARQPIERTPSYMYNRMLQYSGIDYPHHI